MAKSALLTCEAQAEAISPCARHYAELMAHAVTPAEPATLTLAGVMSLAPTRPAAYRHPIHGLAAGEIPRLLAAYFPGFDPNSSLMEPQRLSVARNDLDEFDDLLQLLLDHRSERSRRSRWLAHAIATAAMGSNHLWQDMGLPNRGVLSQLMAEHFTALHQKNIGDMKWKKFFYRQLCEDQDILICRSPHCATCSDHSVCFSQEEGAAILA